MKMVEFNLGNSQSIIVWPDQVFLDINGASCLLKSFYGQETWFRIVETKEEAQRKLEEAYNWKLAEISINPPQNFLEFKTKS